MLYNVKEMISWISNELLEGDILNGLKTGFYELDDRTGGFKNGELIVLGSRPCIGKTSLMLNIVNHISVDSGEPSVVFSMEGYADRIIKSLIKMRAHIDMRCRDLDEDLIKRVLEATEGLKNSSLYIDDTPMATIDLIKNRCYEINRTQPLSFVAIDCLQLIDTEDYKNPVRGLNRVVCELKKLAMELGCPILLLSQIDREVEARQDKHPRMSDLRDCGNLEEVADEVMFLYRDDYYYRDSERKGIAELDVKKSRGGMLGVVDLVYIPEYQMFKNREKSRRVQNNVHCD